MESILKNDGKTLRGLILYKTLKNKSNIHWQKDIWQAFQSISKILGDDFMDFPDFEHLYLKLAKGECDLDYDGRLRSNRHLRDLPMDVFRMIFKKLTDTEKWRFRQSLPSLRERIDPLLPECKTMNIQVSEEKGSLNFRSNSGAYLLEFSYCLEKSEETGESKVRRYHYGDVRNEKRSLAESMIKDVRSVMESRKTRLVDLNISSTLPADNSFFEHLKPLLKSQGDVQNVTILASSSFHFHSVLSGLKPKTLEIVRLRSEVKNLDLSEILELDQMKQAKDVTLHCPKASYPLKSVLHFEDFDGKRKSWSSPDILEIRNESTRNEKMKTFRFHLLRKIPAPRLNELLGPLNSEFNDIAERRHFKIQNSEEFMKMEIFERIITFTRVTEIANLGNQLRAAFEDSSDSD